MKTLITVLALILFFVIYKKYKKYKIQKGKILTKINPQKIIEEARQKNIAVKNNAFFYKLSRYNGSKRFVKTGRNNNQL